MDYILFGVGLGSTLMLLGWLFRTFGPGWKFASVASDDEPDKVVQKRFWTRFVQGIGGLFAILGSIIAGFTILIMLIDPDDGTGVAVTLGMWVLALVGAIVWSWLYVSRFGTTGIWSRGYGYRSVPSTSSSRPRKNRSSASLAPAPVGEPLAATIDGGADAAAVLSAADSDSDNDVPVDSAPDLDTESDALAYDFGDSADTTVPSDVGGRDEALRRLRDRQPKPTS